MAFYIVTLVGAYDTELRMHIYMYLAFLHDELYKQATVVLCVSCEKNAMPSLGVGLARP